MRHYQFLLATRIKLTIWGVVIDACDFVIVVELEDWDFLAGFLKQVLTMLKKFLKAYESHGLTGRGLDKTLST